MRTAPGRGSGAITCHPLLKLHPLPCFALYTPSTSWEALPVTWAAMEQEAFCMLLSLAYRCLSLLIFAYRCSSVFAVAYHCFSLLIVAIVAHRWLSLLVVASRCLSSFIVACRCLSLPIVTYRRLSLRVVACRCLSLLMVAYRIETPAPGHAQKLGMRKLTLGTLIVLFPDGCTMDALRRHSRTDVLFACTFSA